MAGNGQPNDQQQLALAQQQGFPQQQLGMQGFAPQPGFGMPGMPMGGFPGQPGMQSGMQMQMQMPGMPGMQMQPFQQMPGAEFGMPGHPQMPQLEHGARPDSGTKSQSESETTRATTIERSGSKLMAGQDAAPKSNGKDENTLAAEEDIKMVMDIKVPAWFELILAATGVQDLQYKIAEERARRADELFQNPYPITNALVTSMQFEVFVGVMIFFNCLMMGIEASLSTSAAEGASGVFTAFEFIFSFFFLGEWCSRMIAFGWAWVFEWPNAADTMLVYGTGIFVRILAPLGLDVKSLRIYTALRFLRLVRLARAVRLQPAFKEMWILIHGLASSARPLLWVAVIACVVLYIFAVAATELIGRHSDFQDDEYAQELFGDLMKSMFTMLQLITMDTWGDSIARPVMEKQPFLLGSFFICFLGVGVFVFWNLITAIVVDSAFKIAEEDSAQQAKTIELEKKKELKGLADLFLEIDVDKSGQLTKDEFMGEIHNPKVTQMLDLLDLKAEELIAVWDVLDDGDGELRIDEFTNGIRRMKGNAKAKDVIDCVKRLKSTQANCLLLRKKSDNFCLSLQDLEHTAASIAKDTDEVVGLFSEMYHRLAVYAEKGAKEDRQKAKQREKEERVMMLATLQAEMANMDDEDADEAEK